MKSENTLLKERENELNEKYAEYHENEKTEAQKPQNFFTKATGCALRWFSFLPSAQPFSA